MTFYESNKDIHDTGAEIAEFDDAPPVRDDEDDDAEEGDAQKR